MIKLEDITLKLPLGKRSATVNQGAVGGRIITEKNRQYVLALNGIDLTVNPGERVGLIGHNGSGKTTLLRVLAGIYQPTAGKIEITGKISTLLSNSLGLYPHATGRKNIKLGLRLLGVPPSELPAAMARVEAFADLGDFIDVQMDRYSAGMMTRLSFGIATEIRPEILLIDEVIGAGDAAFVDRAMDRMTTMMGGANIVFLSSHSLQILSKITTRTIWLKKGELFMDAPTDETLNAYRQEVRAAKPQ